MKKIAFLLLTVFTFIGISSFEVKTENPASEINWVSIEEAYNLSKANPKKVIIDVYTGWCGWCKVMDKKTFTNPEVIKFVNENYYAVKLDAESREDITVGDKTYSYNEQNRANEAAVALLQGKMSYPSIVYLDEQFNMIQPIPGYMEARQFHEVITFLGNNHYKQESFEDFKKNTYPVQYKEALAGL
ncbi:Thioredoxin-related protein [Spirosomataceae bacterium TFI 002]|nr:Thioredoxin-related protein [Spirosomataceae bacterium TFI 002]